MAIESHMTSWITAELKLPPRIQNVYAAALVPVTFKSEGRYS
ncbi:hypothetical protein ABER99_27480 [Paenibacillus glucanolyticus]|nr:hypothetical protein [Paenibacillus glucanolyticus]